MVGSCFMIFLQTRAAVLRFARADGQRVATVREQEDQEIPQPTFVICRTKQAMYVFFLAYLYIVLFHELCFSSIRRGYGSVDFRELVGNYVLDGRLPANITKHVLFCCICYKYIFGNFLGY